MMNQIVHTFDISLALVAVLANLVFAILVLSRTSRATLYVTFFFGCISIVVWNMGDFIFFLTETQFWFYLSLIGSGMAPALMFHITNALVRPGRKVTSLIILAYIFSSLLALSAPIALLHSGIQKFVDGIAWNIFYFIFLVPFLLSSIFMIANSIRKAESQDEKSRLRYILTAFIIAVFTGITDLVQALKVPIPPLGHLGCVIYSSILAIGILKHQAAYDIFAQMQTKLEFLAEMAAGIAHEIRNPLTSIKGASNLLAQELENIDLPDAREYHSIIAEEIERLNHILIDFQYFTRPLKIEKESVSINEIIRKTMRLAEIGPMRIKTKQEYDENSPKVEADASLLKQVFLNLIKNAEEACGSEGELVIKTEHVPSWIKVSFSDNGPGIPPENLKSIFDPFFSTKPAGIGMGLSICQRIIQAHGGRMEVRNRLPKGTEFSILLPV